METVGKVEISTDGNLQKKILSATLHLDLEQTRRARASNSGRGLRRSRGSGHQDHFADRAGGTHQRPVITSLTPTAIIAQKLQPGLVH